MYWNFLPERPAHQARVAKLIERVSQYAATWVQSNYLCQKYVIGSHILIYAESSKHTSAFNKNWQKIKNMNIYSILSAGFVSTVLVTKIAL
jgi:hypothetical protein